MLVYYTIKSASVSWHDMTWHSLFCRNLAKLPNSIFWTRNDHIGRRVICGCREIRKSVAIICSGCSPCHSLSVHCGKLFQSCCQSLNMNIDLFIGKRFSSESMGGNSSSSLPFCLTPLWDIDLTWNTDNPDFTRYFRPLFIQRLELENIFHKGVSTKHFPPRCFHQRFSTKVLPPNGADLHSHRHALVQPPLPDLSLKQLQVLYIWVRSA